MIEQCGPLPQQPEATGAHTLMQNLRFTVMLRCIMAGLKKINDT